MLRKRLPQAEITYGIPKTVSAVYLHTGDRSRRCKEAAARKKKKNPVEEGRNSNGDDDGDDGGEGREGVEGGDAGMEGTGEGGEGEDHGGVEDDEDDEECDDRLHERPACRGVLPDGRPEEDCRPVGRGAVFDRDSSGSKLQATFVWNVTPDWKYAPIPDAKRNTSPSSPHVPIPQHRGEQEGEEEEEAEGEDEEGGEEEEEEEDEEEEGGGDGGVDEGMGGIDMEE
ncbi:hypothetical protein HK102_011537 [Quaeritorhiza haematococci]|nr:hypothetical protein HK102_011537 [Quaeritorhiza haematococci]